MATNKANGLEVGNSPSLSDKAYLWIRERILRGEVSPGEVISARRLAKEFGMSLLPVSQALRKLEGDKLVESRPRAGTRVRIPNPEEVRGRCIVREALEAQSARLCCVHATLKQRAELIRLARQLDALYDRFGLEKDVELQFIVHTLHFELHMRITEYSGCPELRESIEMNQVLIYNWFFDVAEKRQLLPTGFHARLMRAVTGSDPIAADKAMRAHVQYGVVRTLEQIVPMAANDWRLRRATAAKMHQ